MVARTITEDEVRAYRAAARLKDLYDAYRATSRAHVRVLQRLERGVGGDDDVPQSEGQLRSLIQLKEQAALSRASEAVMAVRRDQMRRRLLDLADLPELP